MRVISIIITLLLTLSFSVNAANPSEWAIDDIELVDSIGLIFDGTLTNYGESITRAEYGYIIYQLYEYLSGKPISLIIEPNKATSFDDTDDLRLTALKGAGLINGYPDGTYKPGNLISREEIMVLYVRLLEKLGYELDGKEVEFNDHSLISDWAMASVIKCYNHGYVKGVGNQKINPKGSATVEESLVVMNRIIQDESIVNREVKASRNASSITSDGRSTYAIEYDIFAYPKGIAIYDDFDYQKRLYEGSLKDVGLYYNGGNLYFFTLEGQLVTYDGSLTYGDFYDVSRNDWYIDMEGTVITNDSNPISETNYFTLQEKLLFYNDRLVYAGVTSYTDMYDQVYFLDSDNMLYHYDALTDKLTSYKGTSITNVSWQWNYLLIDRKLTNSDTFRQYVPTIRLSDYLN